MANTHERIWGHRHDCWNGPRCVCPITLRQLRAVDPHRRSDLLHLRLAVAGVLAIFAFLVLTFVVLT